MRQLRWITIPVAGSGGEGTGNGGGSGNGTGGGNGDGDSAGDSNNGVSDSSSLDAFAMMAPLAGMGSKTDTTNATKSIDPTATSASSLLMAPSNRTNLDGSIHRIASKQSADSGTEKAVRITAAEGSLNVRWSDDFFASFDEREIR